MFQIPVSVLLSVYFMMAFNHGLAQSDALDPISFPKQKELRSPNLLLKQYGDMPASGYYTYLMTGFTPEVRFNNGKHVGASYSLMTLTSGFGLAMAGLSLGVNGDVQNSVYECKVSAWSLFHLFVIGGNFKLNLVRKFYDRDERINSIRPEVGLAVGPIFFNYGLDIYLKRRPESMRIHNFIMTTYIPLYKIKEEGSGHLQYAY